jgi:hypothetical protein
MEDILGHSCPPDECQSAEYTSQTDSQVNKIHVTNGGDMDSLLTRLRLDIDRFWIRSRDDYSLVKNFIYSGVSKKGLRPRKPLFSERCPRWLQDLAVYEVIQRENGFCKEETCICYEGRIVVPFDEWANVFQTVMRRECFASLKNATQYFTANYLVGNSRNGLTISCLEDLIKQYFNNFSLPCDKFNPSTFVMPGNVDTVLRFTFPTAEAADHALSFIAHKFKFQVKMKCSSVNTVLNAMIHMYGCARDGKLRKKDKEQSVPCDTCTTVNRADKMSSFLEKYGQEMQDQYNGGSGVGCCFSIKIIELLNGSGTNIVEIKGTHSGHNPQLETETYRAVHPTIVSVISFLSSTNLPTFHIYRKLWPFIERYKKDRDEDMKHYEQTGTFTHLRSTFQGKTVVRSPLRGAKAYGSKHHVADILQNEDPVFCELVAGLINEKLLRAYKSSNLMSATDVFPSKLEYAADSSSDDGSNIDTDIDNDGGSETDNDDSKNKQNTNEAHAEDSDNETGCVAEKSLAWKALIRPSSSATKEEWKTFSKTLTDAASENESGNRKYIPLKYLSSLTVHPKIFSNYNFNITKEWLYTFNRFQRQQGRQGRTATNDVMHVLEEYRQHGWADVKIKRNGNMIRELVVFIQTPMQKAWCNERIGITDVIQFDDTQNITVWDMPMFVFLATDPQTMTEIPVAQGFVIYETKEKYSKTNCIYWLHEQWDRRGNPPIQTHMFDRDQSSFIAMRMLVANRFCREWETVTNTYGVDTLASISSEVPEPQKEAAKTFLRGYVDPESLHMSQNWSVIQHSMAPELDIVEASFYPQATYSDSWLSASDSRISQLSSSFMPWVGHSPDLVAGVVAVFIDECMSLYAAVQPHLGPEANISWASWESKSATLRSLFCNVFLQGSELYSMMKRSINVRARLCIFHVKKAWAEQLFRKVGGGEDSDWKEMYNDLGLLIHAPSQQTFWDTWETIKRRWFFFAKGAEATNYVENSWLHSDWLPLWPSFERNFSHFCRNTNNGVESFFYQVKYALFNGRRPFDFRFALEQMIGSPTALESEKQSFACTKYSRLQQIAGGALNHRKDNEITRRTKKVIDLLQRWTANMQMVVVIDPLRLVFRVPSSASNLSADEVVREDDGNEEEDESEDEDADEDKGQSQYFVCLATNVCTCPVRHMICKHILALRQWCLTQLELAPVWQDNELETVFSQDLCERLTRRDQSEVEMDDFYNLEQPPQSHSESTQIETLSVSKELQLVKTLSLKFHKKYRSFWTLLRRAMKLHRNQNFSDQVVASTIDANTTEVSRAKFELLTTSLQNIVEHIDGMCDGKVAVRVKRTKHSKHASKAGYLLHKQLPSLIPKRGTRHRSLKSPKHPKFDIRYAKPVSDSNEMELGEDNDESGASVTQIPSANTTLESTTMHATDMHTEVSNNTIPIPTSLPQDLVISKTAAAVSYESHRRRSKAELMHIATLSSTNSYPLRKNPPDNEIITRTRSAMFRYGNTSVSLSDMLQQGTKRSRKKRDL